MGQYQQQFRSGGPFNNQAANNLVNAANSTSGTRMMINTGPRSLGSNGIQINNQGLKPEGSIAMRMLQQKQAREQQIAQQ